MALSFDELETHAAEVLPAREVMSSIATVHVAPSCNVYTGGIANGINIQDVLNNDLDVNALNVANGLVDLGDLSVLR